MNVDDAIDLVVFIGSLSAIGVGVGAAVSPQWAAVVVGGILVAAVLIERVTLRLVGKQRETRANESA